ncbi:hypothetical protein CXG81DRAFT_29240 [Caulochytrium protostelioides]|uniref:Galactose oxidase n=1 Tax=Caulochytrium protostelioides TaxID=1555241 RepID=A0A4P9XEH8_9FUNG|nr:hypothetical protein CXG81DRAFT_29240 [Caulochytrium protostelioides]|eukprot:RKP03560.1 hypothetical protein CXG81DRAFT_29240 [Caulochytrium protostelioides]
MHWSTAEMLGQAPPALRAHTATRVGDRIFIFGGCDAKICYNDLYIFDTETFHWTRPIQSGEIPPPRRAHSASLVELPGQRPKIFLFGGGSGPNYYNTLYTLDTVTLFWEKPMIHPPPPSLASPTLHLGPGPRRAHTSWVWNGCFYLYAGGDGQRALSDIHMLPGGAAVKPAAPPAISSASYGWVKLATTGTAPSSRGYQTSNLIGHQVVVYGGSDGHECFHDVHVLDLRTLTWKYAPVDRPVPRLSHSALQVGSYLFVMGGHDGTRYTNDVLLLNLVTMNWEVRQICGNPPLGRGYHSAILHDSRVFLFGGYNGHTTFGDLCILDLSACAYLPQITTFAVAADIS